MQGLGAYSRLCQGDVHKDWTFFRDLLGVKVGWGLEKSAQMHLLAYIHTYIHTHTPSQPATQPPNTLPIYIHACEIFAVLELWGLSVEGVRFRGLLQVARAPSIARSSLRRANPQRSPAASRRNQRIRRMAPRTTARSCRSWKRRWGGGVGGFYDDGMTG